jgi:catechol 2,3-dioxygenase-like lactoylglutathione lyase family enzyme
MTSRPTHLAINADDLDASRRFYAGVLGLNFADYLGPESCAQNLTACWLRSSGAGTLASSSRMGGVHFLGG